MYALLCVVLCVFFWFDGFFVLPPARPVTDPFEGQETAGIGMYYLNLDRSVKRRQHIESLLTQMPFPAHRVVGVDSRTLSDDQLPQFVDVRAYQKVYGRVPHKGEILCTHSHIQAWRAFLASPYTYALIFEDDALFEPEKLTKVVFELTHKPHLWDVCNLDTRARAEKRFRLPLGTLTTGQTVSVGHRLYGADAYLINREAAKKLLARVQPLGLEIEKYFTRAWELGIKYTGVFPRPVDLLEQGSISRDLPVPQFSEDLLLPHWYMRLAHHVHRWKTGLMQMLHAFWVYGAVKWRLVAS